MPHAVRRKISSGRFHSFFETQNLQDVLFIFICHTAATVLGPNQKWIYNTGVVLRVYACTIKSFARSIYTGNALLPTLFPSIHWDSISAYVLQYVLSANMRCSWQHLTMHYEKSYITVSLAFKTGKIIKVRNEWKNDFTNDKKYINSSMLFHCV